MKKGYWFIKSNDTIGFQDCEELTPEIGRLSFANHFSTKGKAQIAKNKIKKIKQVLKSL